MPQMPPKNEVINDSTDPGGTLRPNLLPEPTFGTHFDPLPCPEFDHCINLPVDPHNLIAIFDLFFTPEQMQILVENINKSRPFYQIGLRNAHSLEWRDTFVKELYAYFGILVYMGLHLENDIDQYWCIDTENQPSHAPVRTVMAQNWWKQINQAFHITEKGRSVFERVKSTFLSVFYIVY
jgi:hypothetical protein